MNKNSLFCHLYSTDTFSCPPFCFIENTITAHAQDHFTAQTEIWTQLQEVFSVLLPGLIFPAQLLKWSGNFSLGCMGWNSLHATANAYGSRGLWVLSATNQAETDWAEIHHVISLWITFSNTITSLNILISSSVNFKHFLVIVRLVIYNSLNWSI